MITECDYVLSEVTKNIYEFQRDIMRTNAKRGVIMSELIIKYFEDYMRLRVSHNVHHYNYYLINIRII